jgi:hypothetical protein
MCVPQPTQVDADVSDPDTEVDDDARVAGGLAVDEHEAVDV